LLSENSHEASDFNFLKISNAQILDSFQESDGRQKLYGLSFSAILRLNFLSDDVVGKGTSDAFAFLNDGFCNTDETTLSYVKHLFFIDVVVFFVILLFLLSVRLSFARLLVCAF